MKKLNFKEDFRKWLIGSINEPIVKILVENSNLTKIQLETFLIDVLSEKIAGKLINDEKAKLRLIKSGVSRGAFNRTLKQARRNIIQAIYTVLLLGYFGVFETTSLDPYIEAANKLKTLFNTYKNFKSEKRIRDEQLRIVNILRSELESSLEKLSK